LYENRLPILAPKIGGDGALENNPHSRMVVRAKDVFALVSSASQRFGEYGPNHKQRQCLATDEELLQALGRVPKEGG
jgi:hypothetical protein